MTFVAILASENLLDQNSREGGKRNYEYLSFGGPERAPLDLQVAGDGTSAGAGALRSAVERSAWAACPLLPNLF